MLRAPLATWKVNRAAALVVLPMATVRVVVRQPVSSSGPSDWKVSATCTARAALTTPKPYQLLYARLAAFTVQPGTSVRPSASVTAGWFGWLRVAVVARMYFTSR
ncbi:hypothetical protein D3C73_1077300 [compost metagenome]